MEQIQFSFKLLCLICFRYCPLYFFPFYHDNIASSHWLSREIDHAIKDKPFHNSTANISKNPHSHYTPALFSYQTVVMLYSDSVRDLMNDVCFWLFLNWLLCFILSSVVDVLKSDEKMGLLILIVGSEGMPWYFK